MYRRLGFVLLSAYALTCALYAGLLVWFTLAEREVALRDARSTTASLARALEEHVSRSLSNADLMLRGLEEWLEERGGPVRIAPNELHTELVRRAARMPDVRALFVYGADLTKTANSLQPVATRIDGGDREYIAVHRDAAAPRLFVARTISSPVVPRAFSIPVTIRLETPGGQLAGVAGAALNFDYFAAFYRSLGLRPDASVSLLRSDGSVLFRFPVEQFQLGESMSETALFARGLTHQDTGTIEMQYPGEAQTRIVSYRYHEELPLVFTVSRGKDAVLANWRQNLLPRGLLFVLVLALGGVLVALLLMQVKTRLAAEQRFGAFFQRSPLAAVIARLTDGRFIEVNDAWLRMFGYARDQVIGATAIELGIVSADERTSLRRRVEEGGATVTDLRLRRSSGAMVDTRAHFVALELEGVRCILGLIEDITERKRGEAQLAGFFHSSPAAHAISRFPDGMHVEVNEAWLRTMGYSREEVIGRTAMELGLWANPEERTRWVSEVMKTGRLLAYPTRHRRKDGAVRDILLSAEVVEMEGGPHFFISIVDVTAEQLAQRATEELAKFFRSSPAAHVIVRADTGVHVEVNDAWMRTFGYAREEVIGRSALELGMWPEPEQRERLWQEIAAAGRVDRFAARIRCKNGNVLDVRLSVETIEIGGVRHILISTEDVTAEMRAQAEIQRLNATLEQRVRDRTTELEAANRELESFSYSVSHDMRAPIRAILGFTEILRAEHAGRLGGDAQRLLDRVTRAAAHMGQLIDALLELSRLMRRPLAREPIDLTRVAQTIFDELRERAPERSVAAIVAPGLDAFADPVLIRSVLENLIDNAWKYTSRTAAGRIEVGRTDGAFYVRDNGAGFDMGYVDRLFRPFERLHRAEEFPGTGVGLATVERIVRRHGGRVWAEGAPGKGATFYFTLPV